MIPITSPLHDRLGAPLAGPSGEPLVADRDGIVYTLQGDDPVAVGTVLLLPDGRTVLATVPPDGGGIAGLGESWWVRNRQLIGGMAAGAAGTGLIASAATPGTGFNSVVHQGIDAARSFFLPTATNGAGAGAAPASAAAPGEWAPAVPSWSVAALPPPMTVANERGAVPMPYAQPTVMPATAPTSGNGLTLGLLGVLGLGALALGAFLFVPRKRT